MINDLLFESDPIYNKNGIKNNYSLLLKNVNLDSKNSSQHKNEGEIEFLASSLFETSYPLKKESKNYNTFLTPRLSFMFSPSHTRNIQDADRRIDINNIFGLNRIGFDKTVEGGQSLTLGTEYKKTNKENNEIFSVNLASVFRDEENEDLPRKSTLGNKTSDIIGNLKLNPNKYFSFDYNFSLDNDFSESNYDEIKTQFSINNFVTSFEFMQENNIIGNESYVSNKTSYNFDEGKSLSFSTRKNRKTNLTEFYNLIYQYKNDCLVAAIEYNKEYYDDNDIKPEEQLFFSLTIIPMGKTNSPNINK